MGRLGLVSQQVSDIQKALDYYGQARHIAREIGDREGEAIHSWNLGRLYEHEGDLLRAVELMKTAVDYEQSISDPEAEQHATHLSRLRERAVLS